jgi:hypothetical protein
LPKLRYSMLYPIELRLVFHAPAGIEPATLSSCSSDHIRADRPLGSDQLTVEVSFA